MTFSLIPAAVVLLSLHANADTLSLNNGVIVHLFEWRWEDIALECEEFLKPKGFAAVMTSPPNENLVCPNRPWWERYQPVSYKLVTRSGNETQLRDMLQRCNKAGIRVIADVILNHMTATPAGEPVGTGGSRFDPKTLNYPAVPYTKDDFHAPCSIQNYNNADEVRKCELVGLHDLNQSRENVRKSLVDYMNRLISIGYAGFRLDAAKHMHPDDIRTILSRVNKLSTDHGFPPDTDPFVFLEVIDEGGEAISSSDYASLGFITDFRYRRELDRHFTNNHEYPLRDLQFAGTRWSLLPSNSDIVFVDNHDTQRDTNTLNYKDSQNYKLAVAFLLAWPYGTPMLMSSFKFNHKDDGPPHDNSDNIISPRPIVGNICSNGWVCEHRWRQIYNMVHFHNVVKGAKLQALWDNEHNQLSFCREGKGFIAFNKENSVLKSKFKTCLPPGVYCDVISGGLVGGKCTAKTVTVEPSGMAEITVPAVPGPDDGVLAIHVEAKLG